MSDDRDTSMRTAAFEHVRRLNEVHDHLTANETRYTGYLTDPPAPVTNAYSVDAGGSIDMPLIGPVFARGATTDELAARISTRLRDGFIREPHVAVEVEAYRPFFILGEVTQPGQYPYVANMTAETAVAIAGGFTPRALRRSVIVNRNNYGHPVRMAVPLTFPLRPGDTVNVQER